MLNVVRGYDIFLEVADSTSLSSLEFYSLDELGDSVQGDHLLNVLLLDKAFLGD